MFIKDREKRGQKILGKILKNLRKIVHGLWIEKGMWEIDEKNLMNQIRMIKSKGWVTNTEIKTIRRKIENEGRDEVNEGAMQEIDNMADINDENVDINHADSANEEPIRITENDLSDSESDRLFRLREALEGDDFGKLEVSLKDGDKEKIKKDVIKMNKVLQRKNHSLYTLQKCHTSSNENRRGRSRHEEIKCKEEKRTFLQKKDPHRYQ